MKCRCQRIGVAIASLLPLFGVAQSDDALDRALDIAHSNLVSRFVGKDGLLRGWEGPDPSPRDCLEGRPSYIGWATPVENGPMFTGTWLPAVCARARRTGCAEDRALARHLAEGLMLSASVSDVPGFISRGTATDGKTHYPWGSTDQTGPWYLGLYFYLQSGLPETAERQAIVDKIRTVSDDLEKRGWVLPCDGVFKDRETCGNMRDEVHWYRETTQYLFMLKTAAVATGDAEWEKRYRTALSTRPKNCNLSRLEILEEGYVVDMPNLRVEPDLLWIYTHQHLMHAELALLEPDPEIRRRLANGLKANARRTVRFIESAPPPPTVREVPYSAADWTKFVTWSPQRTIADSRKVAATLKKAGRRRKTEERDSVTRPFCAAVIAAYSCDPAARAAAVRRILGTDFSALNLCEFFWADVWRYACAQADALDAKETDESGILLLAFDDRNFEDWEAALPLFGKYGAHATFFVSGDMTSNAVRVVRRLAGAGHAVGLHGRHHADVPPMLAKKGWPGYCAAELDPVLSQCAAAGIPVSSFAYPNGCRDGESDRLLLSRFRRLRGLVGSEVRPFDPKGERRAELKPLVTDERVFFPAADLPRRRVLGSVLIGEAYATDIDDIVACIERAGRNKEVLSLASHGIRPDAKFIHMKTDWLEKILAAARHTQVKVISYDEIGENE